MSSLVLISRYQGTCKYPKNDYKRADQFMDVLRAFLYGLGA
jgi:hypothetical protein